MSIEGLKAQGIIVEEENENKGIIGYDDSAEVIAQGKELQHRFNVDFLKMLEKIQK